VVLGVLAAGCAAGEQRPVVAAVQPGVTVASVPGDAADVDDLLAEAEALQRREDWVASLGLLERCVQLDPGQADCQFRLGRAREASEDPQGALDAYFAALRLRPTAAAFYGPPAELCRVYKLYDAAAALLEAGLARVPETRDTADARYELELLRAKVADARGDPATALLALERAHAIRDDPGTAEAFSLGAAYLMASPPRVAEGRALLRGFISAVCRGPDAPRFRDSCEAAATLLQRFPADAVASGSLVAPAPRAERRGEPPLPATPSIPDRPLRIGAHHTVWGASLELRRARGPENAARQEIRIEGYVGWTNLEDAPRCAVHPPGKADPPDCRAEVPTFWLCDEPAAPRDDCIRVMGWASSFAQIWGAMAEYGKPNPEPYLDQYWGHEIPRPIPHRGGRVVVTGYYGVTFTGAISGVVADPVMGILTYRGLEWREAEPPPGTPFGVGSGGVP